MSNSINLDCYMQFHNAETKYVTCGVVLVHGTEEIFLDFETFQDGLYGNGLLELLFRTLDFINKNVKPTEGGVNIFIKLHPRNTNFRKIVDKIIKGYHLVKSVDNDISFNFVMQQHFTNKKDHKKPKTYDAMIRTVKALKIVNKKQPVHLIVGYDAVTFRATRTYYEVCARHTKYGIENGFIKGEPVPQEAGI